MCSRSFPFFGSSLRLRMIVGCGPPNPSRGPISHSRAADFETRPRWLVFFASVHARWLILDRGESHGCDSGPGVADDRWDDPQTGRPVAWHRGGMRGPGRGAVDLGGAVPPG